MHYTNNDIIKNDLKYIFHPCTQMKDHEKIPIIPIQKAKKSYIYDYSGNKYLDCISSWWVNIFGHSNKYINKKLYKQSKKLEHVIFAGFTHKPAVKLAERLIKLAPDKLEKIFFADNGSSAIEISLKMSFQYFKNIGESRPIFISLENSYHGETMGALAVSDTGLYKDVYKDILLKTVQAKSPAICSEKIALLDIENKLKKYDGKVSSVIIEPLVQCAGSMKMYKPSYLKKLRKLCDFYNVFMIADEVAVGFGRTGTMFAVEQANISPDFLCLSKGITAGYLPLSTVLFTNKIYNAFYCDYNENKSFLDSHSYTGNTLACAVANASLDIFEQNNVIYNNQFTIKLMNTLTKKFNKLNNVLEIRQTGMICAIELKGYNTKTRIGLKIFQQALLKGVYIRPLGNVVYFMPPYSFTKKQIKKMINVTFNIIKNL